MNPLDFKEVLLSNPQIALELLTKLANRLDDSEQQTTLITTEDVQSRSANYIFNALYKQDTPRVKLESTKKNIAFYLRIYAKSFSRGLTKLTKMSVITQPTPNIIEILDPNKLGKLAKNYGAYLVLSSVFDGIS